ncbi:MAG: formate--tetrahydrofolate ligase [Thermoplasmata archaeon]
MKPLTDVAASLDLTPEEFVPYGAGVAKIPSSVVRSRTGAPRAKLVLVTSMTPTARGEGKTVTAIGTAMALVRQGFRAVPCLREPSFGPVFGAKGGATGGGRATVEPSAEINLGLTGDLYAVASAQNLLASMLDNHLHHGNPLGIDPDRITVPRTIDLDDRALRHVRVGLGGPGSGPERSDSFVIAAASEVAAIHCLARDLEDLSVRLDRMLVGFSRDGRPIRASDLGAGGAMAAILRHAMEPNLVQTCEGTPAFVHAGPFANLGPGTASVSSVRLALALADYVLVEAGFASELGAEKFVDLVGPSGGFQPVAGIVVATVDALRHHARTLSSDPPVTGPDAVRRGLANLDRHLENVQALGLEPVVAVNVHPHDTPEELAVLEEHLKSRELRWARSTVYAEGGAGAETLATEVRRVAARGRAARPIFAADLPVTEKLRTVARTLYGARDVVERPEALQGLAALESVGLARGPLCVAKTQLSVTDDAHRLGAPQGFDVTVHAWHPWTGAGFALASLGEILAMPGLPEDPAARRIGLNAHGDVTGLL